MKVFITGLFLLIATSALAQQPDPGQGKLEIKTTPGEQALGAKLMQEIQSGLNCSASLISVRAELEKAQARIKELEPKTEEKK